MAWQPPEGMYEYLKPTKLCDSDHAMLKEKANEMVKGVETPKEAALKIFYFIREEIPFGMDYATMKASETLKRGMGFCFTKTNLQIALLRAMGIPARCHYSHLSRELIKEITPGFFYNKIPFVTHPWAECYLFNRWIACEAHLDEVFYKASLRAGGMTKEQVPTIDWDGESDLVLYKHWMIKDVGNFPSIDDVLITARKRKEPLPPDNNIPGWFVIFFMNRHIKKIRKHEWKLTRLER